MVAYLATIDAALAGKAEIVVIGGAAAALGYSVALPTSDIDLWPFNTPVHFWEAVERTRGRPEALPVSLVGIASPPIDFEDRLWAPELGMQRLRIWVPEAHDLALLKTSRCEAHDIAAIEQIHAKNPLSPAILEERYHETLTQVIGPPGRFRLNMLALVARLFGEAAARELEARI
ncbi:MAG: hypothetical protein FJZ01_26540 [Candidatus Sericytochromatia bacterium]|nr:hypothetical protein [Candidatus Tanganyikabacteria bacterium]